MVKDTFKYPSYESVTLIQLSDPEIKGHYKSWTVSKTKYEVEHYVKWVLEQVPETEIYLSMPLSVIKGCLRKFFDLPTSGDLDLPTTITKDGKTIHLSHHMVGIGSNAYKDCQAVVYLWDNHLPQSVAVKRYHMLSGKPVSEASLADANDTNLKGKFAQMRDASLAENVIQQLGRGNMRNIDQDGKVGHMKAYLLLEPKTFGLVKYSMPHCQRNQIDGYGKIRPSNDRVQKVLDYVSENLDKPEILASDIKTETRVDVKKIATNLESGGAAFNLAALGYKFIRGSRGRGKASRIVRLNMNHDNSGDVLDMAA